MEQKTEEDWNALMDTLAALAVTVVVASEFLAASSPTTMPDNWLEIIMSKAKAEYDDCTPSQLKDYLAKTLTAMGQRDISS